MDSQVTLSSEQVNALPFIPEGPKQTLFCGKFLASFWNPLPQGVIDRIVGKSWNTNAPVPLQDLAYIRVEHWNLKFEQMTGELIYHKNLAEEIVEIFQELYQVRYPIEKMVLIDNYEADDERSMEDNNTSAFCSRAITGRPGKFSKHSYGGTIDINPQFNPYVNGNVVLPKNGVAYLDRNQIVPGLVKEGDLCYEAFTSRGYEWGGHWKSLQDYQHFEKKSLDFLTYFA